LNAGAVLQLTAMCLGIQAFRVARLGHRERRADVHFDELAGRHQLARHASPGAERPDEGGDDDVPGVYGATASFEHAVLAAHDARTALGGATISLALSLEALRAELSCFDDRAMQVRPHASQRLASSPSS
jgi:Aromatic amino acid lyase